MLNTGLTSILKPLRASRLDIESEKTINLVSLLRRIKFMARVVVYSSTLKILALFAKRIALVEFLATAAEATRLLAFEPYVYNRWKPS